MKKLRSFAAIFGLVPVLLSANASAENMTFFDSGIDYWSKPSPTPENASAAETPVKSQAKQADERPTFDWQKVMDPKNDDFFREGDYMPPAALIEVARDPSDQNIRMWHAYIAKKNELTSRLNQRLHEYSARHGNGTEATPPVKTVEVTPDLDPKRFRFRMYFDSECPHCKRMMTTMVELVQRGFAVEVIQIDTRPFHMDNAPFRVTRADPEEVKRHGITSVPFLLVADFGAEVVYRMSGFKSVDEIFGELSAGKRGVRQ